MVRTPVFRVDLGHGRQQQVRKRRPRIGDPPAVSAIHHRLRVGCAPDVGGQDPVGGQVREHPAQVIEGELRRRLVRHPVEGIALGQVPGQIHDVPAGVGGRGLEVGVLDHPHEGKAGIVDVQPVEIREAAVQLQNDADVGEVPDVPQPLDVLARHVRLHQIGDDRQGRRRDHGVGGDGALRGRHTRHPIRLHSQPGGRNAGSHLTALRTNGAGQRLGQRGEAPPVVGEPLRPAPAASAAPQLELVPEPDRGHLLRQIAELPPQQRLPHHPVHVLAARLPQPVGGGAVLEVAPVPHPART